MEDFLISVDEAVLVDLKARIDQTRWPSEASETGWNQGTPRSFLQWVAEYWSNEYDWREQEAALNRLPHFRTDINGVTVHFIHVQTSTDGGIPLVLSHGWPSSFIEYLPLIPFLTDPQSHGLNGPAFDVVIPSLPGYGFSGRSSRPVTTRYVAALWHILMKRLGYGRYGAQGGDFGAGIATFMALDNPPPLLGIHLHNLEVTPYTGPTSRPLSEAERTYLSDVARWKEMESGYSVIQSTKPQTLSYGLNDSPVGLAAWILEKWHSWSDGDTGLEDRFAIDSLLTNVTIYWVTETIATSIRDYYDNQRAGTYGRLLGPDDRVEVPTGVAVFDNQRVPEGSPPREWAERLYNVRRWTRMPRGGHFAPMEEPRLLARDIIEFFADLSDC